MQVFFSITSTFQFMKIILLVGLWAKLGGISLEERYLGNSSVQNHDSTEGWWHHTTVVTGIMKMRFTILSTSSGRTFPWKSRRNVKENICELFYRNLRKSLCKLQICISFSSEKEKSEMHHWLFNYSRKNHPTTNSSTATGDHFPRHRTRRVSWRALLILEFLYNGRMGHRGDTGGRFCWNKQTASFARWVGWRVLILEVTLVSWQKQVLLLLLFWNMKRIFLVPICWRCLFLCCKFWNMFEIGKKKQV